MPLTPVFVEKATGDQSAPALEEQHGGVLNDPRLTEYVDYVGRSMLPFSLRGNEPHQYKVLASPKIINAFTLGNGSIYITKGLLNMLDNEAELAEVLGHENGHFGHRHIAAQIDRGVGLGLLLAMAEGFYADSRGAKLTEGQGALLDKANEVIPSLVLNGFGREQELEADEHGLFTMVKAGYDPMSSVHVFEKFQKLEPETKGLEAFFQSHPTAATRIQDLQADINRKFPGVSGVTNQERYQAIVKGTASMSQIGPTGESRIMGVPTPLAIAGGVGLAITTGLVIASL